MQWKKLGGYGSGNYGTFNFALQSNGTGNFPSGAVIAHTDNVNPSTAMNGVGDGPLYLPITATLTAGLGFTLSVCAITAPEGNSPCHCSATRS